MQTPTHNQGLLYTFPKPGSNWTDQPYKRVVRKIKKEMICVLIADDHPYLINGVEADLNKDPTIKIIGTASSYDETLKKNKELKPDVILQDLKMPGSANYDLKTFISTLKEISGCKVIIFSNETGWARIHRCLEIGASGYIEKAIATGKMAEFIHRIINNEELLIYTAEQLPQIQFSPRQKEILHFVADGIENDEIAKIIKIEIKTIQSYVNEVKGKLSEAFGVNPIRPRTLMLLASKLGFGHKL